MDSLEQKIKEYISSVEIPDRVKPEEIKKLLEDNADMTAGVFLRKLKELKISGSDFLELLGNSKIGNMEFRRIEENPHLKFDELLQILDNSVLSGDDYRMIISVATQRKELAEQRKRREEETLRRMTEELTGKKNVHKEENAGTKPEASDNTENAAPASDKADVSAKTADNEAPDNTVNDTDLERAAAAEALIMRMQKELDSENPVENVNNESDYTDSNENMTADSEESVTTDSVGQPLASETSAIEENVYDTVSENADESSAEDSAESTDASDYDAELAKSVTQEFCIPEPPAEKEPEEAEDFDGMIADDEKIGSNAREIGTAIGELMDGDSDDDVSDDEGEFTVTKRRKACLVTSFVGAAVLIIGGFTLNTLRDCGIIQELTYDIPEKLVQNISDYKTFLEEAQAADGKISYALPDMLVIGEQKRSSLPKNMHSDSLVATVNGSEICGAKETDGKLSGNFSFETGLSDVGIINCGEYFAVIGTDNGATVIRTYDESGIINGEAVDEYILSGEFVDYYTDSVRLFVVTNDYFDVMKANADELTTFVPSYTYNNERSAVDFNDIAFFGNVNALNYYTTTSIDLKNERKPFIRTILTGKNGGCSASDNGVYICDTYMLNQKYHSSLAFVLFDEALSTLSGGYDDIAFNPTLLNAMNDNFTAVCMNYTDGSETNALMITSKTLAVVNMVENIPQDKRYSSISGKDKTVTVTTAGDDAMSYSINVDTGKEATAENTDSIKLNDNITAQVTLTADKDGNRTGILLSVGGDKKAEVTITAESSTPGDWNQYLTSPVCDDISQLAFYETDGKMIIGIPIVYFDGISQVSQCKFYSYSDNKLSELGNITLYDEKYDTLDCEIVGGDKPYILTMWDNRVITASIDKVSVISDTVFKTVEKKADNKTQSKTESKAESSSDSKTESKTDSKTESSTDSKGE